MNIAVYCGASKGNNPVYQQAAIKLGKWIARNNNTLIYGGGKAGLMGILADSVLENSGRVIGIIPTFLQERELAHPNISEMRVVESMSERKAEMLSLSDACLALPGGPGTLEEITEVVSWARVGQNNNPCVFFNENDYYEPIKNFYDQMVSSDFLSIADRKKILFSNSLTEIDHFIENYTPPVVRKY